MNDRVTFAKIPSLPFQDERSDSFSAWIRYRAFCCGRPEIIGVLVMSHFKEHIPDCFLIPFPSHITFPQTSHDGWSLPFPARDETVFTSSLILIFEHTLLLIWHFVEIMRYVEMKPFLPLAEEGIKAVYAFWYIFHRNPSTMHEWSYSKEFSNNKRSIVSRQRPKSLDFEL